MGIGSPENPYVENPYAGRIVNVHWKKKPLVCGGTGTADGQAPYPYFGTRGYVGTGDLAATNPIYMFAGACRANQPWTITATVVLDMILGPLYPDLHDPELPDLVHYTQDASYFATGSLYKSAGGGLGTHLDTVSIEGSLHNGSISSPGHPGETVNGQVTGSLSASGEGPAEFHFTLEWSASPDFSSGGANVGVGAVIGPISVRDFP